MMAEIDLSELSEAERSAFAGQKVGGTRKKRVREEAESSVDWTDFAPMFCLPFNMILRALDASPMTKPQEVSFSLAWGAVINKYVPDLGEWKEELVAAMVTVSIFGPAVKVYMEKRNESPKGVSPADDGRAATAAV